MPATTTSFIDNFDGPAGSLPDPTKWDFKLGPHGAPGYELQTYDADHAKLDGQGNLVLTAERNADGTYSSSWVQTKFATAPQYGLIEVSAKMPKGKGGWPAIWMMGIDHDTPGVGWPKCGEIDISEVLTQDVTTTRPTIHGPTTTGAQWESDQKPFSVLQRPWADLNVAFNVYALRWEPGRLRFYLNGGQIHDIKATDRNFPLGALWVYDHPFYLILNLAVGGWAGPPDASTVFPMSMIINYVRFTPLNQL